MWALYCLVQFYNVTHERLQPIKPLAKFISFKAIVFATWWQGVGIVLLCTFGVLPQQEKLQTGLQDFLICIEVVSSYIWSSQALLLFSACNPGKMGSECMKDHLWLFSLCLVLLSLTLSRDTNEMVGQSSPLTLTFEVELGSSWILIWYQSLA